MGERTKDPLVETWAKQRREEELGNGETAACSVFPNAPMLTRPPLPAGSPEKSSSGSPASTVGSPEETRKSRPERLLKATVSDRSPGPTATPS